MRFFLDHDVPDVAGRVLAGAGHGVTFLRDVAETSLSDAAVLRLATERQEVLVTCNRDDFLGLAHGGQHGGMVILIRRRSRALENAKLLALIDKAGEKGIVGNVNFA